MGRSIENNFADFSRLNVGLIELTVCWHHERLNWNAVRLGGRARHTAAEQFLSSAQIQFMAQARRNEQVATGSPASCCGPQMKDKA
jgi:hypothetical protein